jgi:hypothetical protein
MTPMIDKSIPMQKKLQLERLYVDDRKNQTSD